MEEEKGERWGYSEGVSGVGGVTEASRGPTLGAVCRTLSRKEVMKGLLP